MSPNGDRQVSERRFTDFALRLIQCSENAGFNSTRLAQALGVGRATMARYWSGERLVPTSLVFKIADLVGVDPRWLVTGTSIFDDNATANLDNLAREQLLLEQFRRLTSDQQDHLIKSAHLMDTSKTLHSPRTSYRAPPKSGFAED